MDRSHPESALLPYAAGELSGDERKRLELHLESCARCRESVDTSAAIMRVIARDAENLRDPDWNVYRAQLRRRLAARENPQFRRWWRPEIVWPAIAAGTATAVLLIALTLSHLLRGPAMPPVDQFATEGAMSGTDVGLLRNYQVVDHLDLLENYDVIENLDQLSPTDRSNAPARS
jgi:anti-sigma factor RsiW